MSNHTTIHIIISDIENKEYDIVLIRNYTIATKEVLLDNELETELLNQMTQRNNSITIKEIDIENIVINISDKFNSISAETTNILTVSSKYGDCSMFHNGLLSIDWFYIGIKNSGHKSKKHKIIVNLNKMLLTMNMKTVNTRNMRNWDILWQ